MEFSKVGYEKQRLWLNKADTNIHIFLKPAITSLAEVAISAGNAKPLLKEGVNLDVLDYAVFEWKTNPACKYRNTFADLLAGLMGRAKQ